MMSVMSVWRGYKGANTWEKGFPVLAFREYRSLHMTVEYLSVHWHQVCQETLPYIEDPLFSFLFPMIVHH